MADNRNKYRTKLKGKKYKNYLNHKYLASIKNKKREKVINFNSNRWKKRAFVKRNKSKQPDKYSTEATKNLENSENLVNQDLNNNESFFKQGLNRNIAAKQDEAFENSEYIVNQDLNRNTTAKQDEAFKSTEYLVNQDLNKNTTSEQDDSYDRPLDTSYINDENINQKNKYISCLERQNTHYREVNNEGTTIQAEQKKSALKERINKLRKIRAMEKSVILNKNMTPEEKAKAIVKSTVRGLITKSVALVLFLIIIFIIVCGAVFGAIGSFIWQTSSELDTTKIITYLSELDYNQQKAWFNKGKTALEIEEHNDRSDTTWHYYYLVAENIPPDNILPTGTENEGEVNCMVREGFNKKGYELKPTYRGFNKIFYSKDEMLENYFWTTDDYRAALAYLQVKKDNLGWLSGVLGFVGEYRLKEAARELHEKTYDYPIILKNIESDGDVSYEFEDTIYSTGYSGDDDNYYYYFGRKYTIKYLIDNNIITFDSDETKNNQMKEKYEYTYKYGNIAVSNLKFPLESEPDEKISDRIAKHYGKQLAINYEPPQPSDDDDEDVYGKVFANANYHCGIDLWANSGDYIYSPINGLCKATQRDERGYEYVISTAYSGTDFDFNQKGYLVKISCSSASFISSAAPKVVNSGDLLGIVAADISANYNTPSKDNDTENEDIFADRLFPCCTGTRYSEIGANKFNMPSPHTDHIHMEMYKLPCDFSNEDDIEKNVVAAELFFDYSEEIE